MKFPDMNQYITLLFSLLGEFFCHTEPNPLARGSVPRDRPRAPEPGARVEQDLQDWSRRL